MAKQNKHTNLKIVLIVLGAMAVMGLLFVAPFFFLYEFSLMSNPSTPVPTPTQTPTTTQQTARPAPPNCIPQTSYNQVNGLKVSNSSPGVHVVTEPPQFYKIYGYTAYQIAAEINNCTPINISDKKFTAVTTWNISYYYLPRQNSSGLCYVSQLSLGLHVGYTYPDWQTSQYDDPGLSEQWKNFVDKLTFHENGHANIASRYANDIYNGILAMPPTSCSNLNGSVANYFNAEMKQANQAQVDYDTQTNHGTTQGAIWPPNSTTPNNS